MIIKIMVIGVAGHQGILMWLEVFQVPRMHSLIYSFIPLPVGVSSVFSILQIEKLRLRVVKQLTYIIQLSRARV